MKLRELEKRLREEPDNLGLRITVAGALREAGRQDDAVELYRSVAIAYRDQGRTQQAIACCRSILEIAPDDVRCHALLAALVAGHKGRTAALDTGQHALLKSNEPIVLEVGTPPPPPDRAATAPPPPRAPSVVARPPSAAQPPPVPRSPTSPPPIARPPLPSVRAVDPPLPSVRAGDAQLPPLPSVRAGDAQLPPLTPMTPKAPVLAQSKAAAPEGPQRRSSFPDAEPTPLPDALPYHIHDPTARGLKKLSARDLGGRLPDPSVETPDPDLPAHEGVQTRPGSEDGTRPEVTGIANAARRISASLIAATDQDGLYPKGGGSPAYAREDLAAELDTRKQRRIDTSEMAKISQPPPTLPVDLVELEPEDPPSNARDTDADDDALTAIPDGAMPGKAARGSVSEGIPQRDSNEDELTQPRDVPIGTGRAGSAGAPLLASAFFLPLPSDRRGAVLTRFQRRAVASGTTVIRQGESSHPLIVVARGRLEIRHERADARFIALATVGAGEYVGEAALLARSAATSHVVALTDAELLMLAPRDFYEIAGTFPALWAELKDMAERRTREHEARLRR